MRTYGGFKFEISDKAVSNCCRCAFETLIQHRCLGCTKDCVLYLPPDVDAAHNYVPKETLIDRIREARHNFDRAWKVRGGCCSCHINPPCTYCVEGGALLSEYSNELDRLRDELELGDETA